MKFRQRFFSLVTHEGEVTEADEDWPLLQCDASLISSASEALAECVRIQSKTGRGGVSGGVLSEPSFEGFTS